LDGMSKKDQSVGAALGEESLNVHHSQRKHLNDILSRLKSERISLAKGDYLFHQGDQVIHFHHVTSGKVKLTRNTIEGGQTLIYVAMAGETLAEASLFFEKYHCSAVADSEAEIVAYRKASLLAHLEQHPAAMKDFLKLFARQVRDLRAINEIKNIHSAKERILAFIRHAMDEHHELHLEMSLKDVAYQIGLAHETFYRELKKLEQARRLIRKDGYIKLL